MSATKINHFHHKPVAPKIPLKAWPFPLPAWRDPSDVAPIRSRRIALNRREESLSTVLPCRRLALAREWLR